jgi:biotin operon repressor
MFCEMFTKMRVVGLTRGNSCPLPLTQSTIRDALGLSTVHVNRSLMDLRERGLIILEKHVLTIPDWEQLAKEAEFDPHYLRLKPQAEAA